MITQKEAADAAADILHSSTMGGADEEALHSAEDRLWARVLEAIATGAPQPDILAAIALRTRRATFTRHCA